jgi:hypothetical protein
VPNCAFWKISHLTLTTPTPSPYHCHSHCHAPSYLQWSHLPLTPPPTCHAWQCLIEQLNTQIWVLRDQMQLLPQSRVGLYWFGMSHAPDFW